MHKGNKKVKNSLLNLHYLHYSKLITKEYRFLKLQIDFFLITFKQFIMKKDTWSSATLPEKNSMKMVII